MDFINLRDEFLEFSKDENELSVESIARYKYILGVYDDFLNKKLNIRDEGLKAYLNGVNEDDIFSALDHYINKCKINSENTAYFFISVVKQFYRYLIKDHINNSTLIRSFGRGVSDKLSFSFLASQHITGKKLKYEKRRRALNEKEIKTLINYCDKQIDKHSVDELMQKKDKFNNFVKAIMVKLAI